jgi:hypothetical protein
MAATRKSALACCIGLMVAMGVRAAPPSAAAPTPVRMTSQQLSMMLVNSAYPFQREWAANELAKLDWHGNPDAVHALMVAAQRDAAATVRAASIRALACMKCDTAPVVSIVQMSRNDTDPRVQHAADVALAQFKTGPVEMPNTGIRQAAYTPKASGNTTQPAKSSGVQQGVYVPQAPWTQPPSAVQPATYVAPAPK